MFGWGGIFFYLKKLQGRIRKPQNRKDLDKRYEKLILLQQHEKGQGKAKTKLGFCLVLLINYLDSGQFTNEHKFAKCSQPAFFAQL